MNRFLWLPLLVLQACGGTLATGNPDDSDDAGDGGKGRNGETLDGGNSFVDPHCPEAGPPSMIHECDTTNPTGSCPPDLACFPVAIPPRNSCESEIYGTECLRPGTATQNAACSGMSNCASGFVCLITGGDTKCAQLCDLQIHSGCPTGYVCEPIDVPGFAACL